MQHPISPHLCLTACLLFTWCFRSTKPQDPVLSILSLFTWQLSLFHMVITTLKFTWHLSFLPVSLNSYTNDVNTYRTIAYHELISTKCTGACVQRAIPKKRLTCIKKMHRINNSHGNKGARIYCSVLLCCRSWMLLGQWLETMQTYLAKWEAKPGRPELSKREKWAVPQLCLSRHSHQGFYLLLRLKEGAGPQPNSPRQIHIHIMWHLHSKPEFCMCIHYQICV